MAIRLCPSGHYYDDAKFDTCPVCLLEKEKAELEEDKTIGYTTPIDASDVTVGYQAVEHTPVPRTMHKPVVGWLVSIKGLCRGMDFPLQEGWNDIGAMYDVDIDLLNEENEPYYRKLFSVVYDGKHQNFLAVPGKGTLIYLNGVLLARPEEIRDGDEISAEETVLCFQSFCGKDKF